MFEQCNIHDERYKLVQPLVLGLEHCKKSHTFGPAVRSHWLVHYVVSGKGKYTVNDQVFEVFPGQAFFIRPGEITVYSADKEDPWCYLWAGFEADIDALNELPYILQTHPLQATFKKIYDNFHLCNESQSYAIAKIWEIIGCLIKDSHFSSEDTYTKKAISIIKTQYMQDISVKSIADELGLDRSYFSNIFKKNTGLSPVKYIIAYRMKRALSLLKSDKYSVSVVASSVGFQDIFSFSRCFKGYYGVSPTKYKEIKNVPDFIKKLSQ